MGLHEVDDATTAARHHLDLLLRLTGIPTAAGREQGVVEFIRSWVAERPDLRLRADAAGNLEVLFADAARRPSARAAPLYITAHLDHPAFVVEAIGPERGKVRLSFRGGVNESFFHRAAIVIHATGGSVRATITSADPIAMPIGRWYTAVLEGGEGDGAARPAVGDVATWDLPAPAIDPEGVLHAPACDDLAAVAAALGAMEAIRPRRAALPRAKRPDTRLLFTLAEEIGFIGAIAACRLGSIPRRAVILALENSRAFPESPVGGGPIVRVGDRLSIFTPWLTGACCRAAERLFGGVAAPSASQSKSDMAKRPWQRKLMQGGACEASVFCHEGYHATCLCLPLGNYHNMPHLEAVQAGMYDATANGPLRCAPEFIHTRDYLGLVDLLTAIGLDPPVPPSPSAGPDKAFSRKLDELFAERCSVLPNWPPAKARRAKAGSAVRRKRARR